MLALRRRGCSFNPHWEQEFLFIECGVGALCLVCGSCVSSVKKFNIERHYKGSHAKEYGHITGEDRANLVNMLKEDISLPREGEDSLLNALPSTSQPESVVSMPDPLPALIAKRMKTEPQDFVPESSMSSPVQSMSYGAFEEDEYSVVGKRLAFQLRAMSEEQRLLAEKIISEVMYYGRVGKLTENCFIYSPPM